MSSQFKRVLSTSPPPRADSVDPSIPLSFKGEGEEKKKEGLAPLLNTPIKQGFKGKAPIGWGGGKKETAKRLLVMLLTV